MNMSITVEKIVLKGKKQYRILSTTAPDYDSLPAAYLEDYPHVYEGDTLMLYETRQKSRGFLPGSVLTEEEMAFVLRVMKGASERLQKINAEITKLEEEWKGPETYVFL